MFEITALGNGRYLVSDGTRQRLAYATGQWVFLDGNVFLIEGGRGQGGRGRKGSSHDDTSLMAPMPAKVAAVNVVPGQQVSQGDVVIMLEAMKMELPIKAPRAGRVKAVACQLGEQVQPGVPLLELE